MNFIAFLSGILLMCMALFRQDFFVRHSSIFPLYFLLFPVGLLITIWSFTKGKWKRTAFVFGVFAFVEIALIASVWYMAVYQRHAPLPLSYLNWMRLQYMNGFKNTTNFNSRLSQYDSLLTYRFRRNITGRFMNPEFDVEIKTNSLGVRDDESSLRNPAIIVLGDSHGMGWGVEHYQRFSEVIEKKLNTTVLNTSITSYGTYRETKLLNELDLSSCKLLIIQYCNNDLEENQANLVRDQKPSIESFGFDVAERQNTIYNTYFPFKGIFISLRWAVAELLKKTPAPSMASVHAAGSKVQKSEHAEAFFPYLHRIRTRYKGPILVFDLGVYNLPIVNEFQFYNTLHPIENVYFVNVHPLLDRRYYFTIDDHINARGHIKIGTALAEFIQRRGWLMGNDNGSLVNAAAVSKDISLLSAQ